MIAPEAPNDPTAKDERKAAGTSKEKNEEITAEFKYMTRKLAGPKNTHRDEPKE